jgi:hypothetical protein
MRQLDSSVLNELANTDEHDIAHLVNLSFKSPEGFTQTIYVTDYHTDIDVGGNTYVALGRLLGISPVQTESDIKVQDIRLSLTGVDSVYFSYVLSYYYTDQKVEIFTAFMEDGYVIGSGMVSGKLPLEAATASAAYSLRNLSSSGTDVTTSGDTDGDSTGKYVVQARREDGVIKSFTASDVSGGSLQSWATSGTVSNTIVDYEPDFTTSTGGMEGNTYNTLSYNQTIGTDGGNLKVTCVQGPGTALHQFRAPTNVFAAISGEEYTVQFEYYIPNSNTIVDGLRLAGRGWTYHEASPPLGQWVSASQTYEVSTSGEFHFYTLSNGSVNFAGNNSDVVYFRNHKITRSAGTSSTQSATVQTWYDQSGRDNFASMTNTSDQPKIVESGSMVLDRDGKPSIKGSNSRLLLPQDTSFYSSDGSQSAFLVADFSDQSSEPTTTGNNNDIVVFRSRPSETIKLKMKVVKDTGDGNEGKTIIQQAGASNVEVASTITSSLQLITSTYNSGTPKHNVYIDGDFKATSSSYSSVNTEQELAIGSAAPWIFDRQESTDVYLSEFIYYPSDQSANRIAIEKNIASEYNITLPTQETDGTIKIFEGRLDSPTISDNPDTGESVVQITASNYLSDFDRKIGRYTNNSQQKAFFPNDEFFSLWGNIDDDIVWGKDD